MAVSFALFEIAIGSCAIVWTERGVCGIQLPERNVRATRARLRRRFVGAHEAAANREMHQIIEQITALVAGKPAELSDVRLDLQHVSEFCQRVYATTRRIPAGETASYGEIAARVGEPGAARAVGQALGRNPVPLIVPCHRVLAAGGKFGGFSGRGGVTTKMHLLAIEGAILPVEARDRQLAGSAPDA